MELNSLLQALAAGILLGGLYTIIAIGISMTWGMLKIINLAHFSFVFLAAYITFQVTTSFQIDPFFSLLIVIPLFFVIGAALQLFFYAFDIDEFTSLLVTFGLFLILESIMLIIWSADFQTIEQALNPYSSSSIWLGDVVALPISRFSVFIAGLVLAGATQYALNNTYFGKAVRAISQDKEMAAVFGVDYNRIAVLLSGFSASYAAIAGVFIAMITSLTPTGPTEYIGIIFAVVILGGLGNTAGALGAGMIIGVTSALSSRLGGPDLAPLVTFLVLIAALLFRPEGLFTRKAVM